MPTANARPGKTLPGLIHQTPNHTPDHTPIPVAFPSLVSVVPFVSLGANEAQ
ncbi:hypothetical protein [Paraburkholderia kururiensis]|uniref:Uncharacterized protein n=1 Tax=Paraburkholderia kururiensis TaxID=984307 RepID=A0ABZ0WPG5_9BURK|nr:hypothetical protein [Paraburkholderia kururiensis]WQD79247.1 hypothetical protein U0042_05965 [Paraburkholderia kururiensis]